MGMLNKIVSIVILALAIGAAAFAFLLDKKSKEMVDLWDSASKEIKETAGELDKGSGTSKMASYSNLDHKNASKAKITLKTLSDQAKEVIAERDALADSMVEVASTLNVAAPKAEELKSIKTSSEKQKVIISEVAKVKSRIDGTIKI